MYRIVFIAIFAFAASSDGEDMQKCRHYLNPGVLHCCSKIPMKTGVNSKTIECRKLSLDPTICTREICIGTNLGFALPDGTFNKTKFREASLKVYEGSTEILEDIKVNCIDGDLDSYGTPEFCELVKLRNCLSVQFVKKCPEWSEEGDCKGIKESVEECSKL